jgi:hypothetical protein
MAQTNTQDSVRAFRRANEHKILGEFLSLLSIPNIASDNVQIRKNAGKIVEMMKQRGLSPRLLEAKTPNTRRLFTESGKLPAQPDM